MERVDQYDINCPGQVLQEKNWTEKVTDEMKKFEKSIIKAMRVCPNHQGHEVDSVHNSKHNLNI